MGFILFSRKKAGYEQTRKDFNKGLELIRLDGTLDGILKAHGFK